jgi:hypothetical protein
VHQKGLESVAWWRKAGRKSKVEMRRQNTGCVQETLGRLVLVTAVSPGKGRHAIRKIIEGKPKQVVMTLTARTELRQLCVHPALPPLVTCS